MEGNARETYPFRATRVRSAAMDAELDPEQPEAVAAAVDALLAAEPEQRPAPDPWWVEGVRENLES